MTSARIAAFNDLVPLDTTGHFALNFRGGHDNGSAKINSNDLADKWNCSYEFKLDPNWDWGGTGYDGQDRFLANVKIFRLWNPGSTNENLAVTLQGWDNSAVFAIENIENAGKDQVRYFFGSFKDKITKGVWHKFEFEFEENSAPGIPDGAFRVWFDGKNILNEVGLITRMKESGLKRPYVLGFDNMWEPADNLDKQPNDFQIRNIRAEMNREDEDRVVHTENNITPANLTWDSSGTAVTSLPPGFRVNYLNYVEAPSIENQLKRIAYQLEQLEEIVEILKKRNIC